MFYKADVYDNAEGKIGVVTDLVVDNSGNVTTAVVSVGGLLGVGKKDVAVPFKDPKRNSRWPRPLIRKPATKCEGKRPFG